MFASIPGDKWGRKKSLMLMAGLYFISALGCAFGWDWNSLLVFRFIGGLGIGGSSVLGRCISPRSHRRAAAAKLVGLFQFNIVFGILVAYLSNYLLGQAGLGDAEWRWKLGIAAVPAVFFFLMLFSIPQSPRWLAKQGRVDEARKVLEDVGEGNHEVELAAIVESIDAEHGLGDEPCSSVNTGCRFFSPSRLACLTSSPASTRSCIT